MSGRVLLSTLPQKNLLPECPRRVEGHQRPRRHAVRPWSASATVLVLNLSGPWAVALGAFERTQCKVLYSQLIFSLDRRLLCRWCSLPMQHRSTVPQPGCRGYRSSLEQAWSVSTFPTISRAEGPPGIQGESRCSLERSQKGEPFGELLELLLQGAQRVNRLLGIEGLSRSGRFFSPSIRSDRFFSSTATASSNATCLESGFASTTRLRSCLSAVPNQARRVVSISSRSEPMTVEKSWQRPYLEKSSAILLIRFAFRSEMSDRANS